MRRYKRSRRHSVTLNEECGLALRGSTDQTKNTNTRVLYYRTTGIKPYLWWYNETSKSEQNLLVPECYLPLPWLRRRLPYQQIHFWECCHPAALSSDRTSYMYIESKDQGNTQQVPVQNYARELRPSNRRHEDSFGPCVICVLVQRNTSPTSIG